MKKLFCIILLLLCAMVAPAQNVRVAAAANLRYVLDDIKAAYAVNHPGARIDITFGSSGALVQQILNGAQFNLFLSADRTFPEKIQSEGAAAGDVRTYAFGKIALWSNTVDVSKGMHVLTDNSVKKIAIAKPDVAPYGERAIMALTYYKIYDQVKDKLVFAENISQAAQFASTGNAEVGIIALSLALAPDMKENGNYFVPDSASYTPVAQAGVVIKTRERNPEAMRFMEFILSPECKPLFKKYGYLVP